MEHIMFTYSIGEEAKYEEKMYALLYFSIIKANREHFITIQSYPLSQRTKDFERTQKPNGI